MWTRFLGTIVSDTAPKTGSFWVRAGPEPPEHTGATMQLSTLLCVSYIAHQAAIRLWEIAGKGSGARHFRTSRTPQNQPFGPSRRAKGPRAITGSAGSLLA